MSRLLAIPPGFENISASIKSANNKVEMMIGTFELASTMMRETATAMVLEAQAIEEQAKNQSQQTKDEAIGYLAQGSVGIAGEVASFTIERTYSADMNDVADQIQNAKNWSSAINATKQPEIGLSDEEIQAGLNKSVTNAHAKEIGDTSLTNAQIADKAVELEGLHPKALEELRDRVNNNIEKKENLLSRLRDDRMREARRIENVSQHLGSLAQGIAKMQVSADQVHAGAINKEKEYATLMLQMAKELYNELTQAANRMSNDIGSMNQAMIDRTLQAGNAR